MYSFSRPALYCLPGIDEFSVQNIGFLFIRFSTQVQCGAQLVFCLELKILN